MDIDPVEFGQMKASIPMLADRITQIESRFAKRIDEMSDDIKTLLELAHKGQGGLHGAAYLAKILWAVFGGALVYAAQRMLH